MKPLHLPALSIVLAVLLQACSHPIEIHGEGDVRSYDGDRVCRYEDYLGGADSCVENIVLHAYQESYFAIPRPGWYFHHWENYCTDDVLGVCSFDIPVNLVHDAWGKTMPPLVAVFAEHNGVVPETRILTVGDRQWIQPRLFSGVLWSDIKAACADGPCAGTVMGFDVSGWTWAAVSDVNALFNHYIGSEELGEEPASFLQPGGEWLAPFWDDGWAPTGYSIKDYDAAWVVANTNTRIEGMTRECIEREGLPGPRVARGIVWVAPNFYFDGVDYGYYGTDSFSYSDACEETERSSIGAWFFREVP